MKTLTKSSLSEFLTNPINRDLLLILVGTLLTAIIIVTAVFFVIG